MDIAMHARDYKTILKHIELGNCPVDYIAQEDGIAKGVTALIVAASDSTGQACVAELIELGEKLCGAKRWARNSTIARETARSEATSIKGV